MALPPPAPAGPPVDNCRMSILNVILMGKGKDEYVDLIDNALVDNEQANRLEDLLQSERHLIMMGHRDAESS